MSILRITLLALLTVAGAALLSAPSALAAAGARDFWTKERMREAVPADRPVEAAHGSDRGPGASLGLRSDSRTNPTAPTWVPPARPGSTPDFDLRPGHPGRSALTGTRAATSLPTTLRAGVVRKLVADPAAEPTRAHGKIFFSIRSRAGEWNLYVCSGTVVTSESRRLVVTAGHCVFDAGRTDRFVSHWVFVPAYRGNHDRPFGVWPARSLATTREWRREGNLRYDIGAALVARNKRGEPIQEVVGSRGIAFGQTRKQRYEAYGYPHSDPAGGRFDGTKEYVCSSRTARRDAPLGGPGPKTTRIRCDMTEGSSGGGWIADGMLQSVTSYGYTSDKRHLYGPYFASAAQALYRTVRDGVDRRDRRRPAVRVRGF